MFCTERSANACTQAASHSPGIHPGARPAGVSVRVDVADGQQPGPANDRMLQELKALLGEPLPVTVRILGLDRTEPVQAFAGLIQSIGCAAADLGVDPRTIAIAVDAHDIAPAAAWSLRQQALGRGPLYFVGTDARLESDEVLRCLWALRTEGFVAAAFWPLVSSPTPLLDNERGDDLLPVPALQAPPGSAWVWVTVDVSTCVESSVANAARLDALLERALLAADEVHGRCRWPTAAARHDAWLNRRVAVELTGIGEWVSKCQLSLESLSSLAAVDALLAHASARLTAISRRMAADNTLPAIAARDPCRRLAEGSNSDAWRERWQFALERAGLGHRNLLAVSPWSLFRADAADVRAFNLLPALRHVDACTFRRDVAIDHWSVDEFREFHRRAWAVMRQNARPSLVAQQL